MTGLARLAVRLRSALFGPPHRFVTSAYGVLLAENPGDATFRFCVDGSYGAFYADHLRALDEPFVFLDIGANQGLYSLIAAQNRHCVKAVSLEPVPSTFALLAANVTANGLDGRVTALPCGLSSADGEAVINVKPGHSGVASLHANFDDAVRQTIRLIGAATLATHIPDGPPLVVKVDTEGHEQVVLEELARSAFAGRVASLFYEMDHGWSDAEAIMAVVRGMGLAHIRNIGGGVHYDVFASRAPHVAEWVRRMARPGPPAA